MFTSFKHWAIRETGGKNRQFVPTWQRNPLGPSKGHQDASVLSSCDAKSGQDRSRQSCWHRKRMRIRCRRRLMQVTVSIILTFKELSKENLKRGSFIFTCNFLSISEWMLIHVFLASGKRYVARNGLFNQWKDTWYLNLKNHYVNLTGLYKAFMTWNICSVQVFLIMYEVSNCISRYFAVYL